QPRDRPPVRDLPVLAGFGLASLPSAERSARRRFTTDEAQALLAGLSAHSLLPLDARGTAGFGLFLGLLGHRVGWPVARGGAQAIADALVSLLRSLGGEVVCDQPVETLADLPATSMTLLDLAPRQVLDLGGLRLPARYRRA